MVQRIIEFDKCDITQESTSTLNRISEAMKCIEQNFYNMEFIVQKFENNFLKETHQYKLGNQLLKSIAINLDQANDEFYINLLHPVTTQVFDGICKQDNYLYVEVVPEEVAVSNDMDFLGGEYIELINKGEYTVGGVNSYYKTLGTINNKTYYFREM